MIPFSCMVHGDQKFIRKRGKTCAVSKMTYSIHAPKSFHFEGGTGCWLLFFRSTMTTWLSYLGTLGMPFNECGPSGFSITYQLW